MNACVCLYRIPRTETASFLEKTMPNLFIKIGDTVSAVTHLYTPCLEKRRPTVFYIYNFEKFKCITMSFGKQHRKSNAKLPA